VNRSAVNPERRNPACSALTAWLRMVASHTWDGRCRSGDGGSSASFISARPETSVATAAMSSTIPAMASKGWMCALRHRSTTVTCRVLGFSTQAFYKWKKQPVTQRDWDDAHLINIAREIHADDPAFGYRFIADELPDRGITASENRVARLCSQERLWSVFSKKRGLNKKAGPPVHDDLVDRQFTAQERNQIWLTDITEHRTDEGKLYLCAIKDLYSNKIVGYSIDSRMKASLAVSALRNAVDQRDPDGTIVHSDRGCPIPFTKIRT
jgi:transposase InsO family protein